MHTEPDFFKLALYKSTDQTRKLGDQPRDQGTSTSASTKSRGNQTSDVCETLPLQNLLQILHSVLQRLLGLCPSRNSKPWFAKLGCLLIDKSQALLTRGSLISQAAVNYWGDLIFRGILKEGRAIAWNLSCWGKWCNTLCTILSISWCWAGLLLDSFVPWSHQCRSWIQRALNQSFPPASRCLSNNRQITFGWSPMHLFCP